MVVTSARLVYQNGLANVFTRHERNRQWGRRLMQADFAACENYCRGLIAAGVQVTAWHCDELGDIAERPDDWRPGPGPKFAASKRPIHS